MFYFMWIGLNGFVEGVNYPWVDEIDFKGHNEGLGFVFEYTVMNRIIIVRGGGQAGRV